MAADASPARELSHLGFRRRKAINAGLRVWEIAMRFLTICARLLAQAPTIQSPSLERLLQQHQHYLDRVHTLEVEFETWQSRDAGQTWTKVGTAHWIKDGPRERLASRADGFIDAGGNYKDTALVLDSSYAPGESRILNGWGPATSKAPSPSNRYAGVAASWGAPRAMDRSAEALLFC